MRDFGYMFVTELAVFASVNYSYDTAWSVCFLLIPQKSIGLEWLSPCNKSGVA